MHATACTLGDHRGQADRENFLKIFFFIILKLKNYLFFCFRTSEKLSEEELREKYYEYWRKQKVILFVLS